MKKMTLIITIVSVVLVGLIALALGCRSSIAHSGHHNKAYVLEKVTRELDLDEEQQARLDGLFTRLRDAHAEGQEFRNTLHADFLTAVNEEQLDRVELDRLYAEAKQRVDSFYDVFAAELVEFHGMLTPEQRGKLIEKIESRAECRRSFRERGCPWNN